jgi:nucleosome binding factor SPN SPT16 subunit
MTKELKNCIEGDIKLRHNKIASNMEQMLEDEDKLEQFNQKHGNILSDPQLLDYPLPVLLQSGDAFTLNRFDIESDATKLRLSG